MDGKTNETFHDRFKAFVENTDDFFCVRDAHPLYYCIKTFFLFIGKLFPPRIGEHEEVVAPVVYL